MLFLLHVGLEQCEVWGVKSAVWSVKCEGIGGKWEVWSVECEVWSVKFQFGVWRAQCEVWSVKCEVWSVKEAVWSVKCGVWSLKFGVRRVQCEVWSVECEDFASSLAEKIKRLSREGHGRDRVSLNYRSFMFGKLPPPACPGLCYTIRKMDWSNSWISCRVQPVQPINLGSVSTAWIFTCPSWELRINSRRSSAEFEDQNMDSTNKNGNSTNSTSNGAVVCIKAEL